MTFDVEIMLRANEKVFTDRIAHEGEPATWTPDDMAAILRKMLRGIRRLQGGEEAGPIELRGMNWIVSPYQDGVVIAFEIHSASAVAGPFKVPAAVLEALLQQAVNPVAPGTTVH